MSALAAPDTRHAILIAASRLFAEKGFDAVSIRDIVSAAQVNLAAINYHFHSKEDLIAGILNHAFESFARELARLDEPTTDPRDRIRGIVGLFFKKFRAEPEVCQLLTKYLSREPRRIPEDAFKTTLANRAVIARAIDDGRRLGFFREVDPILAAGALIALCTHYHHCEPILSRQLGVAALSPDFLSNAEAFTAEFFLHGLAAHPGAAPDPRPPRAPRNRRRRP